MSADIERARLLAVEDVAAANQALKDAREDLQQAILDAREVGVTRKRLAEVLAYTSGHVYRLSKGIR